MPRPQPKDLICERGGLGPDLERDATVQARERRQRQLAYAEQARAYASNRPVVVRKEEETPQARRLELIERQKEYSARLPKPKRKEAPAPPPVAERRPSDLELIQEKLRIHDEQKKRLEEILPDLEEE